MNPAGYSGKPLVDKLGYKPQETVRLIDAPGWFQDYLQSEHIIVDNSGAIDWVHGFFTSIGEIANFLQIIEVNDLRKGFWVSWPKKSSGVTTDLTEQTFRDYILPLGWVDTKVAAIDDIWSGLKFLRRKI